MRPTSNNIVVSVIIPTYRDWNRLAKCIQALEKQSYPREQLELIVVNNDSADLVPGDFPKSAKVINEGRPGSYAARNAAIRIAKGEILAFTDSDCIPDSEWITNGVIYFNCTPECSRIGGEVKVFSKYSKASVAEKYDKLNAFRQKKTIEEKGTCVTANLLVRKEVFNKVGLFDDTLKSYGDFEWGMRANASGFRIDYVENVIVNHPARGLADLIKKEKRLAGGRERVTRKYGGVEAFMMFLREAKPQLGEFRSIRNKTRVLTNTEVLMITLLRYRLKYVRAYETMKLRLGKQPNRE